MPPLADLQRDFVHAVLDADNERFAALPLRAAGIPFGIALSVHRNTIFGALANALRLAFPTVERLVGEQFFDQLCVAFVENRPPKNARLASFGDGFADFIQSYVPAAGLKYLADVARLDHAIDCTLLKSDMQVVPSYAIDANVSLDIPESLSMLRLQYPADLISDAQEAGDDEALARIDLTPEERWLVLWRVVAMQGSAASARLPANSSTRSSPLCRPMMRWPWLRQMRHWKPHWQIYKRTSSRAASRG